MIAPSLLTPFDLHLFNEGTHSHLYEKLGAHLSGDPDGAWFAVWAPNADWVSVIGDFNGWDRNANMLVPREQSGIWEGFIPGVKHGALYKFHVHSRVTRLGADKADPYAVFAEQPPRQASVVWDLSYDWADRDWMSGRSRANGRQAPWSVYEVHLGSWMRVPEEDNRWLTYRELAPRLADYAHRLGFTHVEFMPVMEHPFYGSWGYQVTGFFAPTSRYGTPQDFMFLIDHLHQHGVGVILDWVPSHFPSDEFGLQYFDGTHLYEHADPRLGVHPDWGSSIFNYGRNEVRGFLLSSALSWLNRYHADGLRVFPAPLQHRGLQGAPRRADDRGGVDCMAARVTTDISRRSRFRHEVGHGLDARHAVVHDERSGTPKVRASPAHVPDGLCLL